MGQQALRPRIASGRGIRFDSALPHSGGPRVLATATP